MKTNAYATQELVKVFVLLGALQTYIKLLNYFSPHPILPSLANTIVPIILVSITPVESRCHVRIARCATGLR